LSFLSSWISLQQSCLADARALIIEVGRNFLSRAFRSTRDPILRYSLVPGWRGEIRTTCAVAPAAGRIGHHRFFGQIQWVLTRLQQEPSSRSRRNTTRIFRETQMPQKAQVRVD
jgi:hypothetical protein